MNFLPHHIRDNPDALPPESSHCRFFRYLLVELDFRNATLAEAIVMHRFHVSRLIRLENERAAITSARANTTASNLLSGKEPASFRNCIQTIIAKTLERRARKRLLNVAARSADEARQKVLYVIAAMVAGRLRLEALEIERIVATVEDFSIEIGNLLIMSE